MVAASPPPTAIHLALNGQPVLRIGRDAESGSATFYWPENSRRTINSSWATSAGSQGTLTISNGLVSVGGILYVADDPGRLGAWMYYGGSFIATNDTARIGDDGNGTFAQYTGTVILDSASVGRGSNAVGSVILRGGDAARQPFPGSLPHSARHTASFRRHAGYEHQNALRRTRRRGAQQFFPTELHMSKPSSSPRATPLPARCKCAAARSPPASLIADKSSAQIQFSSGTLVVTQATTVANGAAFIVGNGTQPATLQLDGGTHSFANGLVISANATLKGTGTVLGSITVLPGGSNQLGTAPASIALTPSRVNGLFRFSFPSTTGKLYDVLAATNVATPNWQLQTTLSGTGATLTYTNSSPASPRFFRVQIR
jgi:hypothetical protein